MKQKKAKTPKDFGVRSLSLLKKRKKIQKLLNKIFDKQS